MRPSEPAPVARARAVADAVQQAKDENVRCETCSAPADEGKKHCWSCDQYWNYDAGEY
ncbi:hypothetical protein [uncultured Hyphomicrobium sp.]|uniref:hypothetical protein n=1 Tax=uncultured Hyphomicrobium sp. TaxID=194373 RepID=UPI0025F33534|nr:hypothetical protein [uncultured Hyphomicrobium sp.]